MRAIRYSNIYTIAIVCVFHILLVLSNFHGQEPSRPAPSPAPEVSPSASSSPTLSPTPSPTPTPTPPIYGVPGWQNFHQWGSVTLFNGLPSNSVRAIAQTNDGVMWFGTDSGLAKFDGRRIQTISLGNSGTAGILALDVSRDGILWIGTTEGAFYLQNERVEFIKEIGDQSVNAIREKDSVLIATGRGQIFKVTSGRETPFVFEIVYENSDTGPDSDAAFKGMVDRTAGILAGTYGNGIMTLDGGRSFSIATQPRFINTIASDNAGNIWIGANSEKVGSGFYSLVGVDRLEKLGEDLGDVLAAEPDENGGVWIGTAKRGLHHYRGDHDFEHFTFESTAGGLRSDTVYSVFIDREGVLWTGTNRGVCRFDESSPFIRTISDNANSNFVRTLFEDSGGGLVAGTNYGLFAFDGDKWAGSTSFPARTIYAVSEDVTKKMIIGGPGGVYDLAGRGLIEGDTRAFANFRGRTYAAIFGRGLQELKDLRSTPVFSALALNALYGADDQLWIGTAEGAVYTYNGSQTVADGRFAAMAGAAIWKIAPGGDGAMWFAGSKGIFHLVGDELQPVVQNYDVRDLIVDGRDVWAATVNGGLLHIAPNDLFGWIVSDLNVEQGLPSQKVFALLKREKELLIGTNRGIVTYLPSVVEPKVVISRVLSRRLHDSTEWGNLIELEFPQNSLLVEVAGLSSRTYPEQFQYSFVLKAADGKIIEKRLGREAQYSPLNLRPGEYTIEARAFSKDLLSSEPAVVRFSIGKAPFPWAATALGVLLFIAVIALIWAIVERRRIVQRNRQLAAARSDLANEAERERGRIARDLHDQTLADLRNLMMKSDEIAPGNVEFRNEIESVSAEIRRICEDLSPSVLENVGLVAALEFLLGRSVAHHKFSTNENSDELVKFPLTVQLHIYRIAQEILSNIKHHSDADLVEMSVEAFADERLLLTIRDNGKPFRPDRALNMGRGVSNIRSRASIINAKIAWDEGPDESNLFTLVIAGSD